MKFAGPKELANRIFGKHAKKPSFPTRWMTYKSRVSADVIRALQDETDREIFSDSYLKSLSAAAEKLDAWMLKLFALQFAILAYLTAGLINSDATLSLLGLSLKGTAGLRELLMILSATIGVCVVILTGARDLRINVASTVMEHNSTAKNKDLKNLTTPTAFNLTLYIPKNYDRWIFPTTFTKLITKTFALTFFLLAIFLWAGTVIIQVLLFQDVLHNPGPSPLLSHVSLIFMTVYFLFGILALLIMFCPLPFTDRSKLLELQQLEQVDPIAANQLRNEIFGSPRQ